VAIAVAQENVTLAAVRAISKLPNGIMGMSRALRPALYFAA